MSGNYIKKSEDGKRSVYYPESAKKYQDKIKQYKVTFSLSDDDQATVRILDELIEESGLSANAYLKQLLRKHVDEYLQS